MSRRFYLRKDYYDMSVDLFPKQNITIKPGITVLVGCNGTGKSTLLRCINQKLQEKKIPVICFDNLRDGGSNARQLAMEMGNMRFLANSAMSSEGENIAMHMTRIADKVGIFLNNNPDEPELWLLFDAIDSGFSVDNIIEIKEYFFKAALALGEGKDIYIVVSANEYELARDEQCFDVYNGKYIKFNDYEDYRNFIIQSRSHKDKRVVKPIKKSIRKKVGKYQR